MSLKKLEHLVSSIGRPDIPHVGGGINSMKPEKIEENTHTTPSKQGDKSKPHFSRKPNLDKPEYDDENKNREAAKNSQKLHFRKHQPDPDVIEAAHILMEFAANCRKHHLEE